MKNEVCTAHDLLIDNMTYIRGKQDETVTAVKKISDEQIEMRSTFIQMQDSQEQIIKMLKKRKWTPARISIACAALFGSGSAFPTIITLILTKVGK